MNDFWFILFLQQLGSGEKGPAPGPIGGEKGPPTGPITNNEPVEPRKVNN